MDDRHLDWPDCANARDLGGLRAADGRAIRRGAAVRADSPGLLTDAGWDALVAHGVRTIIDLRNDDELDPDRSPRPAGLNTVRLPLDGVDETEFWDGWATGPQFGTPLYYRPHLDRFPGRSARVLAAIAEAPPGGVLFHCVGGRDRTGQITMLLLALLGVEPEEIAADYALTTREDDAEMREFLAARGTTAPELIVSTLAELDVEACLRGGGLTDDHLAALRARLLTSA